MMIYLRHATLKQCRRYGGSVYIVLNCPSLRRNWFSQLYFHFSHQLTTRPAKYS